MRQAVIWKHTLKWTSIPQDIVMPVRGQIIHVEMQNDNIQLWEMHEAEGPEQPVMAPRTFCLLGTGDYTPNEYYVLGHCGTVQTKMESTDDFFVWHVLELAKLTPAG